MAQSSAVVPAERAVVRGRPGRHDSGFIAAVTATFAAYLVVLPTIAAVASLLAFVRPPQVLAGLPEGPRALLVGLITALVLGGIVALVCHRIATPQQANGSVYGHLSSQVAQLDAQLAVIRPPAETGGEADQASVIAYHEARQQRDILVQELTSGSPGLRWLLGTGYTALWSRIHHAQEALIQIMPAEIVLAGALYDDARLHGSDNSLKNAERLRAQLREAALQLTPSAGRYLDACLPAAGQTPQNSPSAEGQPGAAAVATSAAVQPVSSDHAQSQARAILRQITHTINAFRDEQWEGLLRLRNRLMATVLLTGLVTYVLLGLAIVILPLERTGAIMAGVTFYLVGALIGLFNRLRMESDSASAVEDYGLAVAHLIRTPLFSGLAAVSGVLITAILASFSGLGPTSSAPEAGSLEAIFRLSPGSLLMAALFGLTPGLLVDRLDQAKELTNNIRATAPPTHIESPAPRS